MEKSAVFLGGYGQIGEIPHGQLRLDWGLKVYTCTRYIILNEINVAILQVRVFIVFTDNIELLYNII